jgi:hypothetical protein
MLDDLVASFASSAGAQGRHKLNDPYHKSAPQLELVRIAFEGGTVLLRRRMPRIFGMLCLRLASASRMASSVFAINFGPSERLRDAPDTNVAKFWLMNRQAQGGAGPSP